MKYRRIGIAGYMGAGKTTCSRYLAEKFRFRCIDADIEAKRIMMGHTALHRELAESFGEKVIAEGTISFAVLGRIVFDDIQRLRQFNSIVHPLLLEQLQETIFNDKENSVPLLVDAALLPLWNVDDWFDLRIWVDVSFDERLKRQMRKGLDISRDDMEKRMRLQERLFDVPSPAQWKYVSNENGLTVMHQTVGSLFPDTTA